MAEGIRRFLPRLTMPRRAKKPVPSAVRPWDTTPGRSAPEWFAFLNPIAEASRQVTVYDEGGPNERTVVSKPRFRNVIENGELV